MAQIITQSTQQHLIKHAPNANSPVPLRWMNVLHLHLRGKKDKEIAEEMGYTPNSIYRILHHPNIQYVRQQLLAATNQEFEALLSKVTDTLREEMDNADSKIRLDAIGQWAKLYGKVTGKDDGQKQTFNVTAEDVVFQILNGDVEPSGTDVIK